ncbi:MAG: hydrogenase 2 maturation endopeptidase [Gammaproteobacteria bacterium]|nr:MAG: hydrogenase 2 maturation endopeptidase [Gammaproteobacteria bacterium]
MNTLLLGVGNILLQDEGVGVRVVEEFQRRYLIPEGLDVLDGGTSGIDLLHHIANREHLIIVDAVKTGDPPGTVIRLGGDKVPAFFRQKITPHQLGISDVLAVATLRDEHPKNIVLIGIVPLTMETGLELSTAIAAKLDTLIDRVLEELEARGLAPEPIANGDAAA